jgi:AraC-like DNA-binding protein
VNIPAHLSLEQIKLAPSEEWLDEHNAWRFVRLRTGAAYWMDRTSPRGITPGELLVLPPGAKALIRASQLGEAILDMFGFAADLLLGLFTLEDRQALQLRGLKVSSVAQFLPTTHPASRRFAGLLETRASAEPLLERIELLHLALAFLCDGLERRQITPPARQSVRERFQEIVSRMPDLEIIQYTPEQLANLCGCSARHFNRLFQKHFGQSTRARQMELRLRKACELLADPEMKIAQVARESGYRNVGLFNALFKRQFGATPSEWRQRVSAGTDGSFRT